MRTTPTHIDTLKPNEVFVFGSNKKGKHTHGAAAKAMEFGAVLGQSEGLQGQSYAINTKSGMEVIETGVQSFIRFAIEHPHLTFLVTHIGCGLAKHTIEEVAPLFFDAMDVDNIWLPESFWLILKKAVA